MGDAVELIELNVKDPKTQEWWVDVTHQVGGRIRAEEGLKADV